MWGITPDNAVWRKLKGGAWALTTGRTAAGTNISGKSAVEAAVVGTDGQMYMTMDGGGSWGRVGLDAKWVALGSDELRGAVKPNGDLVVLRMFGGLQTVLNAGNGVMITVGDVENIYTITGDSSVWKWSGGTWQNQGFMSRFIAAAKGGLLVSIGTDGRC